MLQKASQEVVLQGSKGESSISLYRGAPASPGNIAVAVKRLQTAFPKMEAGFFNLLAERFIDHGFTEERLKDAVNNVIDTFRYKELNIADVLGYDQRLRVYTYDEVSCLVTKGERQWNEYEIREINGTPYRVLKTDLKAINRISQSY